MNNVDYHEMWAHVPFARPHFERDWSLGMRTSEWAKLWKCGSAAAARRITASINDGTWEEHITDIEYRDGRVTQQRVFRPKQGAK